MVENAAQELFAIMERLDPDGMSWDDLSDHEKQFYRLVAEDFMAYLDRELNR
jgi:ribonucleotide reductase beta subunit family protein with ferritin-like domain